MMPVESRESGIRMDKADLEHCILELDRLIQHCPGDEEEFQRFFENNPDVFLEL